MSCLLHGSLAFAAILFVQRMELAPQAEPFKWNVALIASSSMTASPAGAASVAPTRATIVPAPASRRPAPPPTAAVATVEPLQSSVDTTAIPPSPPVIPVVPKPAPITRPLPPPAVAELAPQPVPERAPSPGSMEPTDQPRNQAEPIAPLAVHVVPSLQHAQTEPPGQTPDSPAAPSHDSTPAEPGTPSPTLDPPSRHTSTAPAEQMPSAHGDSSAITKEAPLAPPLAATSGTQVIAFAPAGHAKPAKIDYGWLADLMAGWIEDLDKRYPAMLRTEGIQGRVTLTALLHEDGKLSDVRVAKSSGNAMLDQVAVDDVRKGPPVTLSRPLERPHMSVKFSIIYDLKTAR